MISSDRTRSGLISPVLVSVLRKSCRSLCCSYPHASHRSSHAHLSTGTRTYGVACLNAIDGILQLPKGSTIRSLTRVQGQYRSVRTGIMQIALPSPPCIAPPSFSSCVLPSSCLLPTSSVLLQHTSFIVHTSYIRLPSSCFLFSSVSHPLFHSLPHGAIPSWRAKSSLI